MTSHSGKGVLEATTSVSKSLSTGYKIPKTTSTMMTSIKSGTSFDDFLINLDGKKMKTEKERRKVRRGSTDCSPRSDTSSGSSVISGQSAELKAKFERQYKSAKRPEGDQSQKPLIPEKSDHHVNRGSRKRRRSKSRNDRHHHHSKSRHNYKASSSHKRDKSPSLHRRRRSKSRERHTSASHRPRHAETIKQSGQVCNGKSIKVDDKSSKTQKAHHKLENVDRSSDKKNSSKELKTTEARKDEKKPLQEILVKTEATEKSKASSERRKDSATKAEKHSGNKKEKRSKDESHNREHKPAKCESKSGNANNNKKAKVTCQEESKVKAASTANNATCRQDKNVKGKSDLDLDKTAASFELKISTFEDKVNVALEQPEADDSDRESVSSDEDYGDIFEYDQDGLQKLQERLKQLYKNRQQLLPSSTPIEPAQEQKQSEIIQRNKFENSKPELSSPRLLLPFSLDEIFCPPPMLNDFDVFDVAEILAFQKMDKLPTLLSDIDDSDDSDGEDEKKKSKSGVQKPLPIRGTSLPLIEIHASPMRQKQLMKSSMHAMPVMNGIVDVPLFNVPVVFEEDDDKLYCICRTRNEISRPMVQCDVCCDWFHFICVAYFPSPQELEEAFVCPDCKK